MSADITQQTSYSRNRFVEAQLDFTPSPTGAPASWTFGEYVFAPDDVFVLDISSPITFTATVTLPPRFDPGASRHTPEAVVTEYFWQFGDGTTGYGNPVDHNYRLSNGNTAVRLRVTDDQGRRFFVQKQIYLAGMALFPGDGLYPSDDLFPGS